MKTICGIDCTECIWKEECRGCIQTDGRPFGGECIAAECYKSGGEDCFLTYKRQTIEEFNALRIPGMPVITELCSLRGAFVNLPYTLPNGQIVTLLDDKKIYLGYQAEKKDNDRCYGLVVDREYLLVCEYGCNGENPEIIIFKKR